MPGGALVLVDDGVIVGVEPAGTPVPDGCEVTHLAGTTLLPGLVDTHVHLCGDNGLAALDQIPGLSPDDLQAVISASLQQQLTAGVTTVRDLGDHRWAVLDRRGKDDDAPTILAAGPPITSPGGHCFSMGGEAAGVEALRRAVEERAERGADVVKIMASGGVMTAGTDMLTPQFTLEELRTVVDEAHRHGLPVAAHAHSLAAVEQAVSCGVDGIEHCSCLTAAGARLSEELAGRLAASEIVVCPTLGRLPGVDPPPAVQARLEAAGTSYEQHLPTVADMVAAGVVLTAGTDAGIGPSKRHGLVPFAVTDLVDECGMRPIEALAAATSVGARACGLGQRTGRLAVGLDADLLVVDGDPLTDVSSLQRPRVVVARGREVPLPG
jgi:imidazolonepropionase-like amidohydrolase